MLRRWHVLLLILVTLAAFCGLAAAKLRATPKYDRVQVGMPLSDVEAALGNECSDGGTPLVLCWENDEGVLSIQLQEKPDLTIPFVVKSKRIERRGPLERLAWLAGWR